MNTMKMAGLVLIVAGILALVYGGFTYTKETHDFKFGTLDLTVYQTQTVNLPLWSGIVAIGVGGLLYLLGDKK